MEKSYLVNLSVLNRVVYFSYSQSHVIEVFLFCVVRETQEKTFRLFSDLHVTFLAIAGMGTNIKNQNKSSQAFLGLYEFVVVELKK